MKTVLDDICETLVSQNIRHYVYIDIKSDMTSIELPPADGVKMSAADIADITGMDDELWGHDSKGSLWLEIPADIACSCQEIPPAREPTQDSKTIASELAALSDQRRQLIRDFYHDLAIALPQLAELLEFAVELDLGGNAGPLLEQHLILCEMMEAFKKIELGKYL